jgi:hypothetical protein
MNYKNEWQSVTSKKNQSHPKSFNRFNNSKSYLNTESKRLSILKQVSNGSITAEYAEKLLKPVQYRTIPSTVYIRTTKSGAVAVYGFSNRPIVLYEDKWNKFLDWISKGNLKKYLEENSDSLRKPSQLSRGEDEAEEDGDDEQD